MEKQQNSFVKVNSIKQIDEWVPDNDNSKWSKYKNDIYMYTSKIPNVEYFPDEILIKSIATITTDDFRKKEDNEYDLYRIIKIYNDDKTMISYVKNSKLYNTFVLDIYYKMKQDKQYQSRIDNFGDDANIHNIKYKLIGIYKTQKDKNIRKDLELIKRSFENNDVSTTGLLNDKYDEYITSLLNVNEFTEKKYYIQKIHQKNNTGEQYIFGSFEKLGTAHIKKFIDNMCIQFKSNKLKVDVIKEINVYIETQGLIETDNEIKKNDSIYNGLNRYYNVLDGNVDLKSKIFMMTQYDIMKNSNEKALIKTYQKKDNSNILYNVQPGQAYLVRKEDFGKMTE